MTSAASITAVIVNHEQAPSVVDQLRSYRDDDSDRFSRIAWHVVHNGPAAHIPVLDAEFSADAVQIHLTANRGYGAAINQVIRSAPNPYYLALNADLVGMPGFLSAVDKVIAEIRPDDRIGIVGLRLYNADGTPQGSAGHWPTLTRVLRGLVRPRSTRKYLPGIGEKVAQVPWVTGACLLLRRECLEDLAGFDERFFLYYEDVDLCRRAWSRNWKVLYHPAPRARHLSPYHSRPLTHRMVLLARRGLLLYFWKHRPRWEYHALAQIALGECRWRQWTGSATSRAGWKESQRVLAQFCRDPSRAALAGPNQGPAALDGPIEEPAALTGPFEEPAGPSQEPAALAGPDADST